MKTLESDRKPLETFSPMERKAHWRTFAIGAGIVVGVTFGFFLLFFNRFAGVRCGNGMGLAGSLILRGRVPYKNWFLMTPPLFALENALWSWLFGSAVIVPRIMGVFERALMATVLYLWLSRLFRTSSATLGAIVAIVVSAGNVTDDINPYQHEAILWAIVAGFFASLCLQWRSKRTGSLAAFFCGIGAGLSCASKQTIGPGITVAVLVLVAVSLWKETGFSSASRFAAWFCAGWAVPIACISYWLHRHGALGMCIRAIFLRGPSAKAGTPIDFIVRWLTITLAVPPFRAGFIIAVILLIFVLKHLFYPVRLPMKPELYYHEVTFVAVLSVASIGTGAAAAYAGLMPWAVVIRASIYFTLLACGLLAAVFSLGFLFGKLSDLQRHLWLLATVAFVCASTVSLSWPAHEAMVIPGLGFLVAAFLDLPSRRARAACYIACVILLFSLVVWKLRYPYAFDDWYEPPVMAANTTPSLPELWGLRLPQPEVNMLEGAARIIREHSTPQDTILTYPLMPIFHIISHRWWPGYSADHNFDSCPDDIARADAAAILHARPAVIIYYRQTPEFLKMEEALWRGGKRAGQRDIIAAVEELVKHYKLAASYPVPPTKLELDIYVRNQNGGDVNQTHGGAQN